MRFSEGYYLTTFFSSLQICPPLIAYFIDIELVDDHAFDDRCLMAVWDEGQRRDRLER